MVCAHVPRGAPGRIWRDACRRSAWQLWPSSRAAVQRHAQREMSTSKNPAKVVFSGIQPTGVPHVSKFLSLSKYLRVKMAMIVARQLLGRVEQLG